MTSLELLVSTNIAAALLGYASGALVERSVVDDRPDDAPATDAEVREAIEAVES